MVWENKTRVPAALGLRGYSFFARVPALSAQAPVPAGWAAVRSARCSQPEAGICTAAGI